MDRPRTRIRSHGPRTIGAAPVRPGAGSRDGATDVQPPPRLGDGGGQDRAREGRLAGRGANWWSPSVRRYLITTAPACPQSAVGSDLSESGVERHSAMKSILSWDLPTLPPTLLPIYRQPVGN